MISRCFERAGMGVVRFDKDNKNPDFKHKQATYAQSMVLSESILVAQTVKNLILTRQNKLHILYGKQSLAKTNHEKLY